MNKELIAYSLNLKAEINGERTITIPEGIQVIGAYALAICKSFGINEEVSISLPSTLVSIGDYAFANGSGSSSDSWYHGLSRNLTNLKSIGEGAFQERAATVQD